jgi:hypothetical protein
MHDSLTVRHLQRCADLQGDLQQKFHGEWALFVHLVLQIIAIDKFHDEIQATLIATEVFDANDVVVLQPDESLDLTEEPLLLFDGGCPPLYRRLTATSRSTIRSRATEISAKPPLPTPIFRPVS